MRKSFCSIFLQLLKSHSMGIFSSERRPRCHDCKYHPQQGNSGRKYCGVNYFLVAEYPHYDCSIKHLPRQGTAQCWFLYLLLSTFLLLVVHAPRRTLIETHFFPKSSLQDDFETGKTRGR